MKAMTALASLLAFAWVIVIGELANFGDTYSRTAYALGVVTVTGVFVVADVVLVRRRRG